MLAHEDNGHGQQQLLLLIHVGLVACWRMRSAMDSLMLRYVEMIEIIETAHFIICAISYHFTWHRT